MTICPVAVTSCAGGRHNMPRPCDLDPESGVRVACDVGYLCANFSLSRTLCSRLRHQADGGQHRRSTVDLRVC